VKSISWKQVAAWRARRHGLHTLRPADDALAVVSELCGVHAQLMSSAGLTLHARLDGFAAQDVDRLLWQEKTLVKTWCMRGTLHLLPAAEYPLWQAGLDTYAHYRKPVWLRNFHITAEEQDQLLDAVHAALDGQVLTREQLADEVTRVSGDASIGDRLRESWGAHLKPASFQGKLLFGPNDGQKITFARPDQWLPAGTPPAEPLPEIATRFLNVHGPATREDFARWWGVTPAEGAKILAGTSASQAELDGQTWWVADLDAVLDAEPVRGVRLLPAFDQYVVAATRHAGNFLRGGSAGLIYRPQGWLSAVVVVDAMFAGIWRHQRKGKRLVVEVEPFKALSAKARKGVEAEVERLAGHLGGVPEIVWS
jgi:hypothetical protein